MHDRRTILGVTTFILFNLLLGLWMISVAHGATEIKQSAGYIFRLGPFVDATDGVTEEKSLSIPAAEVKLSKAGEAFAAKNDASAPAHDANGFYTIILNGVDVGTPGPLTVYCLADGAAPVWQHFQVVQANWWDSKYSTDKLQIDVNEWRGASLPLPAIAGVPVVDANYLDGSGPALLNMVKWFSTHWASVFDDVNAVPNTRTVAFSATSGVLTATGASAQLQTDDEGYVKISAGTATGQLNLNTGRIGINWADVLNPSSSVDLSGTEIAAAGVFDVDPNDLVSVWLYAWRADPNLTAETMGGLLKAAASKR